MILSLRACAISTGASTFGGGIALAICADNNTMIDAGLTMTDIVALNNEATGWGPLFATQTELEARGIDV